MVNPDALILDLMKTALRLHHEEHEISEFPLRDFMLAEITRSMQTASHDLDLSHLWVVYPGAQAYQVDQRISVLPLQKIPDLVRQLNSREQKVESR